MFAFAIKDILDETSRSILTVVKPKKVILFSSAVRGKKTCNGKIEFK